MAVKTEYKGANVEEAIDNACTQLKVPREKLNIEVVSAGSAGLFGLCRRKAVIVAVIRNGKEGKIDDSSGAMSEADNHPPKTISKSPRHDQKDHSFTSAPSPEIIAEISSTLQEMLNLLDITSEVKIELDQNHITAQVSCEDEDSVIGKEGENIDAIQYLLRKIISHKSPTKIFFSLDVGNYRERRKKHLESLALSVAAIVKESNKNKTINALNPAERRIVHVTLQNDTAICSVSIGDGLFKKIKIYVPGNGRNKTSPPKKRNNRSKSAKSRRRGSA